ncbi:hydroxymethylpyrimidine/phosphomethylpyrimidine kinase [Halogranum amylolyticum]|uniref:Hydroxymethylpyrimidine/phosphomethylpyrimidine kinase n=1 Tax=Halogranum amylolyticum TaxID=660520 RepID=A0A1H8PVS8_9EURY|nr:bifunctional hydroxymethylpyrimidine kinase/phosphomethylpyrimidine kinase [Halogranum amylolyticum]SEO46060.1 hydroxymethylpyrimidine/phosphomethylpyrimidine kinase [Halogranum amylolyticum]
MRRPAPASPPVALTVAGSDSGGGAGIQADLKTMEAHGVFGTSVVTAVTAQNTRGVASSHVLPTSEIEAQFDAVVDDFELGAVKTGMLATADVVETVTERLADVDAPVVVDPVMVATSGDRLLSSDAESAYEELVAAATLVTPNVDEAEVLTGVDVTDDESAREAGETLIELGAKAALVKGGHLDGDTVVDTLVVSDRLREKYTDDAPTGLGTHRFEHPRVDTEATHGSGCALSSAVAATLARGNSLVESVTAGTDFLQRAVRYGLDVGKGPGAVHHLVGLRDRADQQVTVEEVAAVVERFVDRDVSLLVPEVGMNVVGATPYAESPDETAAVEGRITRTLSGVHPNRGVRLGASSHVARFLLAAREVDPTLRFAVNCRFADDVEAALSALDGAVAEFDRAAEPDDFAAVEGNTMQWGARRAFESAGETPVAVVDRGAHGKEPIVKLLAADPETVAERTLTLLEAVETEQ